MASGPHAITGVGVVDYLIGLFQLGYRLGGIDSRHNLEFPPSRLYATSQQPTVPSSCATMTRNTPIPSTLNIWL